MRAQARSRPRSAHYDGLFGTDPRYVDLRETFAMRDGTVDTPAHRRQLSAFFFWTAWAAVTERPGSVATYTSNWPYEPALGNTPTSATLIWSVFSIVFLLAGIALLSWHYVAWHRKEEAVCLPGQRPAAGTAAQRPRCAPRRNTSGS